MKVYQPVPQGRAPRLENTRAVYVVDDLTFLAGPQTGTVTLPLRLDWTPAADYDLGSAARVRTLYVTVLREAQSTDDLITYLNRELLIRLWPTLRVPPFVRQAWETAHPELSMWARGAAA